MSHRKFEAPRHGHLGFLPRKRCTRGRGRVKAFPADNKSKNPHYTAFMGYKAGSTHVIRDFIKSGQKEETIEVCEGATVIDTPPMQIIGVTGYTDTAFGKKKLTTVWTRKISRHALRRFAKSWRGVNKNVFRANNTLYNHADYKEDREAKYNMLAENASVIRVIAHTLPQMTPTGIKKAAIMEIQINGGSIADKLDFAKSKMGGQIEITEVFQDFEMIDTIGISKGKGFKGVVSRWGVTRLPRKTHKGLRKVACIGAWHPSRVAFSVARAGQKGYHHRTERNKKIYRIGGALDTEEGKVAGKTVNDITEKSINPMGGFPNYGYVKNAFVMIKGSCPGAPGRLVVLRKTIYEQKSKRARDAIVLKFIDTASKYGVGRYQTSEEKLKFEGKRKRHRSE
eukprot:CAMPEP_0117420364 /NCGR_PEP_ID=MMETSP0758-20121206/1708_1 /TAXON_ID=63605 /ORGANISM="Percolomonas cosmopolitus, Strain AE-1 (ATCC 50343)" /LENGTH=395 /DNA_ID=CAMNT_0005201919 /DNA_START=8 /DNA_END=1195 /DNA_ORIENTATION=-